MISNLANERILIVSHGHPDHSKGGAEVAAYNLYREYRKRGIDSLFLARTDQPSHGGSIFSTRNGNREILFHTSMSDWFNLRSIEISHLTEYFTDLLKRYKPTVVHFHHYAHMGLEMLKVTRKTCPTTKILFTLHEYMAICFNNGQMVKKNGGNLCYDSNPVDCAKCFTEKSSADFFMRKQYIQSMFDFVDQFISPSYFLIERYKAWGIPETKLVMIENGQPKAIGRTPRPKSSDEKRGHFAYFGQINPFKGIDILLEAFSQLPENIKSQVHLDIHGANLHMQEAEFQNKIKKLLKDLEDTVTLHGSYESHEIGRLMLATDWMIIPSIWWENSPIVIQEAYNHGRPIICSDIGGMAEKIIDNETGIHFRARNAVDLCHKITLLIEKECQWERLSNNIKEPLTIKACADLHLKNI